MRRIFLTLITALLLTSAVSASSLNAADRDYLIRQVAGAFPDVDFGGRVGICAVLLNRMENDGYPDTAPTVIASLMEAGFAEFHEPDEKSLRLTADALKIAESGADPTDGALYFFRITGNTPVYDLRFDNSGEKQRHRELEEASRTCTAVIGGIGFRK